MEQLNKQPHADDIYNSCSDPAGKEGYHLMQYLFNPLCITVKYPSSIGYIGKQNRQNPGNDCTCYHRQLKYIRSYTISDQVSQRRTYPQKTNRQRYPYGL